MACAVVVVSHADVIPRTQRPSELLRASLRAVGNFSYLFPPTVFGHLSSLGSLQKTVFPSTLPPELLPITLQPRSTLLSKVLPGLIPSQLPSSSVTAYPLLAGHVGWIPDLHTQQAPPLSGPSAACDLYPDRTPPDCPRAPPSCLSNI